MLGTRDKEVRVCICFYIDSHKPNFPNILTHFVYALDLLLDKIKNVEAVQSQPHFSIESIDIFVKHSVAKLMAFQLNSYCNLGRNLNTLIDNNNRHKSVLLCFLFFSESNNINVCGG